MTSIHDYVVFLLDYTMSLEMFLKVIILYKNMNISVVCSAGLNSGSLGCLLPVYVLSQ